MDFTVADERALIFKDKVTQKEAEDLAWNKKIDAFGMVNKFTSFLSRPKDEDFKLTYQEHRYQPFWHIVVHAHYVYDRNVHHHWPVTGPEVKSITVDAKDYTVTDQKIAVDAIEHCEQDQHEEVLMEGLSGEKYPQLKEYLSFASQVVTDDLTKHVQSSAIIVPPKARASVIVRESLSKAIKGIEADQIFEETVRVEHIDLYYRPVFAFQYHWESKNKDAIVEVDGLTGKISFGHKTFKEYLGKALDKNFLFDIGADMAGTLIPGGSIAVKLAKKVMDAKKK